ncbi:MAG TPA: glycoside hydrolase family 43 protein [Phnomibacter sp.]|nr:glycoside hydrolase family 43 protein [Phnomibacter sp.]
MLKKPFRIAAIVFLLAFTAPQVNAQADSVHLFAYFKNNGADGLHLAYSKDGFNWTALFNDSSILRPTVSKDKLMRDPCIIKGADSLYHMVWTVSWNDRTIGYASSKDLVHWSEQQAVRVMMHEDSALNCWAPEITYDQKKQQYMIYWATTIPGRFKAGDTAGDGKYNHRMYYVTTKDFKTYSSTKLLYDKGFNVIDATIQPNGKGWVMFLKDETKTPPQKNIRIAYSKQLNKGYGEPSKPITGNYWAEGPAVLKKDGKWIVYFDKYRNHQYGAVVSSDLVNWNDISDKISMPKGIRHGTIFTVSAAEFAQLNSQSSKQ